ncbi:polysaccharide biosynthesis/export family protein [Pedobacter sp. SYP-B3415]|uniref:polysaccharide biosynthesis/export family protein n=1 Tax=Pedobacter sp. SYP-B3415 TaxID=2496641 RepID=UPI001F0ECE60|nr:polysaccharide biosynthesis/export family protein [Pedobacter sp. SYP-B3415]
MSVLFLVLLGMSSCVTTKNVPYFQDISPAERSALASSAKFTEPTIQPDDILSISVFAIDATTGVPVNQLATQNLITTQLTATGQQQAIAGFLVDKNGEIELSGVGKIKLNGMTTAAAAEVIRDKAKAIYKDPNVQVRYANFKVTVLGEVLRPSTYVIPNEKVTVLDALGMAGDMTIYGKRENVLLVRDNNGQKEFARLNLNSSSLFNSPYYYLKQNDVLYIEPNKAKAASLNSARTQTFAIVGSALSVLIILLTRI